MATENMIRNFNRDPRDYALALVETGHVDNRTMLIACLKYLSHDQVKDMLDANELSPRFYDDSEGY